MQVIGIADIGPKNWKTSYFNKYLLKNNNYDAS